MSFLSNSFAEKRDVIYLMVQAREPTILSRDGSVSGGSIFFTLAPTALVLTPCVFSIAVGQTHVTFQSTFYQQSPAGIESATSTGGEKTQQSDFFKTIFIYQPSLITANYVMTINNIWSFNPNFLNEVPPADFSGAASDHSSDQEIFRDSVYRLWNFSGALYSNFPDGSY
jgi:hypothetical protein